MEEKISNEFDIENDTIELEDEEGNIVEFKIEDIFEYKTSTYAILVDEDEEAILMEVIDLDDYIEFLNVEDNLFEEIVEFYEKL